MTEETSPHPADDCPFEPDILVSVAREQVEVALNRTISIEHWDMACDVLHEQVDNHGEDFGLRRLIIADMASLLDAIERDDMADPGEPPDIGEPEPMADEVQDALRRLRENANSAAG